jgi:hypothetical protein
MQCNSRASGLLLVKILAALAFVVAAVQHFSRGKHRDGWLVTFANQSERGVVLCFDSWDSNVSPDQHHTTAQDAARLDKLLDG